jgi:hypothetical protein
MGCREAAMDAHCGQVTPVQVCMSSMHYWAAQGKPASKNPLVIMGRLGITGLTRRWITVLVHLGGSDRA